MKTAFQKQMEDWAEKSKGDGLSGSAHIIAQTERGIEGELDIAVGEQNQNATKIPPELLPYLKEILAERDNLLDNRDHKELPTLNDKAAATLAAINIIRERYKEKSNEYPNTGC